MINVQDKIYQWSVDVPVYVDSDETVQFAQVGSSETMNVETEPQGEVYTCNIPNVLLQEAKDIFIYQGGESERVSIIYRAKPDDYVYTETEVKDYDALAAQLEELQEQVDAIDVDPYELPIATTDSLGGIKVGQNLTISSDGTLGAPYAEKGEKGDKGDKGDKGEPGEPGADGAPGKDGVNGQDGADGQDGYTPQRGVDYWTQADINTIEGYIDAQIAESGGGSSYSLPPATATTLGGIKVGSNLSITADGTLSATGSSGDGGNDAVAVLYLNKNSLFSGWGVLNQTPDGSAMTAKKLFVYSGTSSTSVDYLQFQVQGTLTNGNTTTAYVQVDAKKSLTEISLENGYMRVIGFKPDTGVSNNGFSGEPLIKFSPNINMQGNPMVESITQLNFDYYNSEGTKIDPTSDGSSCIFKVFGVSV